MSGTPPEARIKYSRAPLVSKGPAASRDGRPTGSGGGVDAGWSVALRAGVLGGAVVGAVLLIVSEFLTLYTVATTAGGRHITSVSTGSHDAFALVPIALVAVALAYGAVSRGSRPALLALAALGVATLLIALIGDLPDAQATGVVGSSATHFQSAGAKPDAGLYIETLGAILLLIAGGCGLLLGAPGRPRERRPGAGRGAETARASGA